ncbi:MAG: hypothetical protein J6Z80_04410, partial [Clostridia bacterium]|nr:hypothetical protein [Clostridia bacterium]
KSHYDSDYWGYSFVMPDKDVTVTARFYTKDEIWGTGQDTLADLKEKYPEYFGLSTFKGLEVYVWQMNPESWYFGLMSGTNRYKTSEELMNLKGATAGEMSVILSSYGIDERNIEIIPWQNPVSSYIAPYWIVIDGEDDDSVARRRQDYISLIREMLFLNPVPAYESKVAYANWTDSEKLLSCLNADKLTLDSEPHVPVFRFDTKGDLDKFRETFGDVLTFTYGYDEVPSFDEATAKYDDGFFAGHTVVLAYVGTGSGSFRFGIGDISVNGSKLCLHIDDLRKDLQEETCDLAGWLVMAEFADADIAGITDFDAVMGYKAAEAKDPGTEEGDDAELAEFDWTYWQERQVEKEKEYDEANLIMHATPYMESFHPVGISWVINNSPFVVYRVVFYHSDPDTQTESEVYISKETGEFSITIDDFDYDSLWRDDIDIRLNEISFEIQGRKEGSPDGDWYSTPKYNFFPPEWLERKHAAYPEIYGDGKEDPETASIGLYRIYDGHEDDHAWKYYWEIPQAILSQGEVYGRCLIIDEDGQTIYTTQVEKYIEFDDFDARFPYPIRNPNTSENPNSFIFTIEEIEEISERCVKDPKNLKIAVEISHGQSFEQSRISEEQLTGMVVLYREVYLLNHRSQTADRPINE